MGQPELKTAGILEQINQLPVGFDFRGLDARRILKEIQTLRKVAPSESFMLEGLISALAWRNDDAIKCFDTALKFNGDTSKIREVYAFSLGFLSRHDQALEIYLDLVKEDYIRDPNKIACAIWSAAAVSDIESFNFLDEKYAAVDEAVREQFLLSKEERDRGEQREAVKIVCMEHVMRFIKDIASFVEEQEIDKAQLKKMALVVNKVANENQVRFSLGTPEVDDFYGESIFHIKYLVEETGDKIHDMNEQLFNRIAEEDYLQVIDKVVPSFSFGKL